MKAINWTATAALARTLLILGTSMFVGALVMPLAADGTLPLTWAAWRHPIAVALAASVGSEIIWIRTHLAQTAQALGLPAAPPAPVTVAAKTVLVAIGLGAVLKLATACNQPPTQVATEAGIGLDGVACVLDVYAVDTAQGKSVQQAAGDAVVQCAKYGVSEAQAMGLFQSHRMAEVKEGFVLRPDGGQ